MKGVCIDTGSTTVLQEGQNYYVFEHGPNNFYVSKFNNEKAHFGSYRRTHFKLVEEPQIIHDEPFELSADAEQYEELVEEYKKYNIDVDAPYRQQEQPAQVQPKSERIKLKRFVAMVSKYRNGFRFDDLYIITEKGSSGFYHVYLKDRPAGSPIGSYVTNFFDVIMEYDEVEMPQVVKRQETPKLEVKEPPVTIPLPKPIEVEIGRAEKPKTVKQTKRTIPDGQMDIFDFLEA